MSPSPLTSYLSPPKPPAQRTAPRQGPVATSIASTSIPFRHSRASPRPSSSNRIPSPFGVNVTRDGRQAYAPVLRVAGGCRTRLPSRKMRTCGSAWMATQQLHPTRKLGVVGNGRYALPTIDWPKFLILITAESGADVAEPDGKVALRGFSPSARMQPPDLSEFLMARRREPTGPLPALSRRAPTTRCTRSSLPPAPRPDRSHPPIPAGVAMMPAEMPLPLPAASPFLPRPRGTFRT